MKKGHRKFFKKFIFKFEKLTWKIFLFFFKEFRGSLDRWSSKTERIIWLSLQILATSCMYSISKQFNK